MSQNKVNVVFTGKLVKGANGKAVLAGLARLFKADDAEIRKRFGTPGAVVFKNIDNHKAEKIVSATRSIGALCEIKPIEISSGAIPVDIKQVESSPERSAQDSLVVDLKIASSDFSLAPVICSRISFHSQGLHCNRLDRAIIPFDDLIMVTVYNVSEVKADVNLLLYTKGHKRPLLIHSLAVSFTEFPAVAAENQTASMRNFINYLLEHNRNIIVDRHTKAYLQGEPPYLFVDEPNLLTTAMFKSHPQIKSFVEIKRQPLSPSTLKARTNTKNIQTSTLVNGSIVGINSENSRKAIDIVTQFNDDKDMSTQIAHWAEDKMKPCIIMLIVGFLLPILKASTLFGSQSLLWPWQLMGFGHSPETAAAQATFSNGDLMLIWTLLPLIVALLIFSLSFLPKVLYRGIGSLLIGLTAMTFLLIVFYQEAEIFGLVLVPPSMAGGIMSLLIVVAGGVAVAINRLRRFMPTSLPLRIITGLCGLFLIVCVAMASLSGVWSGFLTYTLYLMVGLFSLLILKNAITRDVDEPSLDLASMLARGVMIGFPLASIFAQDAQDNAFVTHVVAGGGGLGNHLSANLKLCLIYYPSAALFVVGFGVVMTWGLLKRANEGTSVKVVE